MLEYFRHSSRLEPNPKRLHRGDHPGYPLAQVRQRITLPLANVEILHQSGKHQKQRIPGKRFPNAKSLSGAKRNGDVLPQRKVTPFVQKPFRSEVFRIAPELPLVIDYVQSEHYEATLGDVVAPQLGVLEGHVRNAGRDQGVDSEPFAESSFCEGEIDTVVQSGKAALANDLVQFLLNFTGYVGVQEHPFQQHRKLDG